MAEGGEKEEVKEDGSDPNKFAPVMSKTVSTTSESKLIKK